jgi:hypothetical protein
LAADSGVVECGRLIGDDHDLGFVDGRTRFDLSFDERLDSVG